MKAKTSPRMPLSRKQEYLCETCLKTFRDKSDFGRHINRKNPCSPPEKPTDDSDKPAELIAEEISNEHQKPPDQPNEDSGADGRSDLQDIESSAPDTASLSDVPECGELSNDQNNAERSDVQISEVPECNNTDMPEEVSGDTVDVATPDVPEPATVETPEQNTQESVRRKPRAPRKKGGSKPDEGVAVLPLGSENLDHLTSMKYPRLKKLIECKPEPSTVIRMVQAVHLDKKVLQNFNVRIDNTSATVFQRSPATRKCEWVQMSKDDAVEKLVTNGIIHFYNIAHVLEENMKQSSYDELMDYLDKIDTAQNDKEADEDMNIDVEAIADGVHAALAKRCN